MTGDAVEVGEAVGTIAAQSYRGTYEAARKRTKTHSLVVTVGIYP